MTTRTGRRVGVTAAGWPSLSPHPQEQPMTNDEPQFGIDDCTCIPFTRQTNPPRYLNRPTDTVDMISGWERGRDCPHHAPAVPVSSPPPDQTALRDRIAEVPAAECSAQNHNYESGPRLCIRAAQHRGDHIDEHGFHWSDTVAVYPIADGTFRTARTGELRRLAAEAPQPETPNTDRAAVYREVADRLTTDAHGMQPDWARIYKRDAAVKVREWADRLDGEGAPTKKLPAS